MRVLGLDLGTTSVGHALIDYDQDGARGQIVSLGVRIFPETRDPRSKMPLNQERRARRMVRRQLRRRRQRRADVARHLFNAGLLPARNSAEWDAVFREDPYDLRRRAIAEPLAPHQIGRLIHHLNKRRHFKGREDLEISEGDAVADASSAEAEEDDEVATSEEREAFRARLRETGLTVGAYLASLPSGEKRRGYRAHRSDIADEFDRIWTVQSGFNPTLLTSDVRDSVEQAIFFQRPVFWRVNTLGTCRLVDGERPSPKGAWVSHQRRMFEALNNLAICGGNERPLDSEEREAILSKLQTVPRLTWAQCRKIIGAIGRDRGEEKGWERRIKFNLELTAGLKGLPGNPLEAKLSEIIGDAWNDHPARDAIRWGFFDRLMAANFGMVGVSQRIVILTEDERRRNRKELARRLASDYDLSLAAADKLANLPVTTGWDAFSANAIALLLPELERGERLGALLNGPEWEDWRNRVFPTRDAATGEVLDQLPTPKDPGEGARLGKLRNPTVVRVQNEMRKVVNNLIRTYGRPDLIRIEVTRDVGRSARERDEAENRNRRQNRERDTAAQELRKNGVADPRRRDIEKYMLWREAGERCPYSGDHVSFADLFGSAPRFDVEHIRPRSRSLDDSFGNKTICRQDMNLVKANRTPYEAFGNDPERWDEIVQRVTTMGDGKSGGRMPRSKVRRFLETDLPNDFADRQLNDSGWSARSAVESLKRLWPDIGPSAPVTVQAVSGRVTAHLRRLWGLNGILGDGETKSRDDHRHHAVDALVVACADPGVTNRLSRFWQAKDDPEAIAPEFPAPWNSIREDAESAVSALTVSHKVLRKVSGPMHEQTNLGDTGESVTTKSGTYRLYVTRKPVADLTESSLTSPDDGVCDDEVRTILLDRIRKWDGNAKKAFSSPVAMPSGQIIRKTRIRIKRQTELMAKTRAGYAKTANNHHVAVFEGSSGNAEYKIVSLLSAARRLSRKQAIIDRETVKGQRFLFSLCPGDALHLPGGGHAGIWIVRSIWDGGRVVLERHTDSVSRTVWRPTINSLMTSKARKISIDPIGRIRPARD